MSVSRGRLKLLRISCGALVILFGITFFSVPVSIADELADGPVSDSGELTEDPSAEPSSDIASAGPSEPDRSDGDAEVEPAATALRPAKGPAVRLPASLPDGRLLRPIALYQSQMDELIPDHYLPVAIDRLSDAVTQLTDRATDDQASRLKGAVYWVEVVDDTLVSDRSVIDIESDRQAEVRRSLGKVNFAIEQPQSRGTVPAINVLPRLESEPDGNLVAVFRGDAAVRSGIEFRWRLRGRVSGSGYEFTMRLPRTPQTRIVLSAPAGVMISSSDGVLQSRPGPPPDASEFVTDRELRWYELDAGGLSSVRIRTHRERAKSESGSFVIRRSSVQYEADPGGMTWTCRMVVQLPPDLQFPPLVVSGTTITGIKINAIDVPYTVKTVGGQARHLQLDVPPGVLDSQAISVNVTLTGNTTWSDRDGWCDLPMPIWMGDGVVHASAVDDVQLAVIDPLQIMAWQLPDDWKQAQEQRLSNGITVYAADGPPEALAAPAATAGSGVAPAVGREWSRVRFINRAMLKSSDIALRLEVATGSMIARVRVAVQIDPNRIEPLRLYLEEGWSLDAVAFAHSGRVIENPSISENSGVFVLWPEAEDADGSEIVIEATGTKLLPSASAGLAIPPTWFVRPSGVRGDLVAAIVPRSDLNWSGEAAMQRDRIKRSQLTAAQRDFFGGLNQETLYFSPETGRTPLVALQTPSVLFNATTNFEIGRDRDEVTENLIVEIESQSQSLKELAVQTGPSNGRPPLIWSLSGSNGSPSISLPSSDVAVGEGESDGIYTIDVSDKSLRGRRLIARRHYPIDEQLELQLPSVPGAASQVADVVVDHGLLVKRKSRSVQSIPFSPRDAQKYAGESLMLEDASPTDAARPDATGPGAMRGFMRLRYDAVEQPSITLEKSDINPNVTVVWREQVRVIASSRGTDRIEATYKVSPTAALRIEYDPELQLASITRDEDAVDLMTIPQRPIVLQPRTCTETIRVVWNRSQYGLSWMRQCRIPRIMVSGTVLKSEYQLIASSDTFAPAALVRGQIAGAGSARSAVMRPGESATLIRRNIALAIGWLIALLAFAISWFVAERAPMITAAFVVVLTTLMFLWWPWRLAVIGWLIVPVVAAAMLATSKAWRDRGSHLEIGANVEDASGASRRITEDLSADFSLKEIARFMLLLLLASVAATAVVTGQDASGLPQTAVPDVVRPVNVLVPVGGDGALSGEMVYIPESVHAQLFRRTARTAPQDARFQSANYRVRIDPTIASNDRIVRAAVEAEYLIHIEEGDRSTNWVRLPIASTSVRRIELIDDVSRIIQFKADATGQVIAMLPQGNAFRIRATLLPAVSESDQWAKLFLSIPPVASSRLTIESEQNIDALRVGGAAGRLLPETDLRRWVEELGPSDSLEIEFRSSAANGAVSSKPLQRRYWIHAGKRQITIDCEVDPPNAISAGETFQFVVRDSAMPSVTSPAWRLDGSELYSPTRRLLTLTSTRDSPGPIRLLWTQPVAFHQGKEPQSVPIRIPEVIAAALGETSAAWVALHCDSTLLFAPLTRDNHEPLSVDHFLAAWSGYRGRIDRAYVALNEIPTPVVQMKVASEPTVSQRHHLHVMPDRLELRYAATLTPSDSTRNWYTLRLPPGLQLIRVLANDQEVLSRSIRSGDSNEILVGSFVGAEPVAIKVVAVQGLPSNMRFTPPRLSLLPAAVTSDLYTISRDRSTSLRQIEAPTVESIASQQTVTADSLAQGWLPVATWKIDSDHGFDANTDTPGGLYEVKVRQTRFDCRQLIVLNRDEERWGMETFVRFRSNRIPDFIDVEVPTRWCESLEITPTTAWSRQPATDALRQIIRIRCDDAMLHDETLSIRGQLQSAETGRVSVPSVRVLGFGQRQIHINVPGRLINEPIQWRTSAVEAVKLPPQWSDQITETMRSTYLVANPSWSIDLAPLPEIDAEAIAVSCDTQVFAQNDGALVMCHWDLLPGGLESVDVQLPRGATCLGSWSAGQAVVAGPVNSSAESESDTNLSLIRVPLSLSRLSQTVEVLVRVPASIAKQARYLPELVGVPVTQNWLTNYVPEDSIVIASHEEMLPDRERAVALARAVVEAVEAVDVAAQRPRDEVAAWLAPWLARYRMIAESVGHVVDLESQAEILDDDATPQLESATETAQRLALPGSRQWKAFDARMARYASRFLSDVPVLPDVPVTPVVAAPSDVAVGSDRATLSGRSYVADGKGDDSFVFGVADFDGFVTEHVTRLSAVNRPLSVQPASSSDRGLRDLIVNVLTLFLVGGVLFCLRPVRRYVVPVVVHPAFWLGLMGVYGFAVAPVPVAGAILLVAVSLPVFPSKRPLSRSRVG